MGGAISESVYSAQRRKKMLYVSESVCAMKYGCFRKSACNKKDFVFQGSQRKGLPGFDIPDDILEGLFFCFYLFACLFGAIQVFQYFSAITIAIFLYIFLWFVFLDVDFLLTNI